MQKLTVLIALVVTLLTSSATSFAQGPSREELLEEIKTKRVELTALEKSFLSPAEEDQMLYAEFLRTPNTGLVRLLPREKFDSDVYKENRKSIAMRGGGAFYSFSRLTHEYGSGNDLALDQGWFYVGFSGADYGFMTNVGDLPLELLNLEHPAVSTFYAYKPAKEEPEARREYRRFIAGAVLDGLPVKRRSPAQLNSTYLLRSITYLRSDLLVAFRVVRVDSDGSTTIIWKLLKSYEVPKLNAASPGVLR